MKKRLKSFLVVFSIFLFAQTSMANVQTDLKEHFVKKLDEVIAVVKNAKLTKERRNSKIITLLTPMFDFKLMARLSLGKVTWNKLSKDEQQRFVDLYVKRMKNSYSSKIDGYKDEKIEITGLEVKKNRVKIKTNLVNSSDSLEVVYKFYKPRKRKSDKDLWLIYDVEIMGISILKADRAQFKEYLRTKTISQLIDELDTKKTI